MPSQLPTNPYVLTAHNNLFTSPDAGIDTYELCVKAIMNTTISMVKDLF
jgi:hypothetical protein